MRVSAKCEEAMQDMSSGYVARALRDVRGGTAIMSGLAVDLARLDVAQTTLQSSVDSAALAGAAAWQGSAGNISTTTIATNYFNRTVQSSGVTISGPPIVTAGTGTYNGNPTYNVQVSATATLKTVFMAIGGISSLNMAASATAANPSVHPVVTFLNQKSQAADWNSAYMYAVPNGTGGTPDFTKMPVLSSFYEIASNCNSANPSWTSSSQCNGGFGATVPTNSGFPTVSATTPLAFMFVNMNNGQAPSGQTGYGQNQYGAQPGTYHLYNTEWMNTSANISSGYGPSENADNSTSYIYQITGYYLTQATSNYAAINHSLPTSNPQGPNCALVIVQVNPNALPTSPPSTEAGRCSVDTDPNAGAQFANLSCQQIAGRTFYYWWNDMGGNPDDYNYDDLAYTLQCLPGTGTPNGGNVTSNNTVGTTTTNLTVSLIQ
jgi:hypothetical protein